MSKESIDSSRRDHPSDTTLCVTSAAVLEKMPPTGVLYAVKYESSARQVPRVFGRVCVPVCASEMCPFLFSRTFSVVCWFVGHHIFVFQPRIDAVDAVVYLSRPSRRIVLISIVWFRCAFSLYLTLSRKCVAAYREVVP